MSGRERFTAQTSNELRWHGALTDPDRGVSVFHSRIIKPQWGRSFIPSRQQPTDCEAMMFRPFVNPMYCYEFVSPMLAVPTRLDTPLGNSWNNMKVGHAMRYTA